MPLKLILTGPESTGKTSMALQLAEILKVDLVPEFSRQYLLYLGRPYHYPDLEFIGAGQKSWEVWHEKTSENPVLVCDTDWTVIRIWELYKYGTKRFTALETVSPGTHYFLCAPDIPFEHDILRENPDDRDVLFGMYHALLTAEKAGFTILEGSAAQRLKKALHVVQKIC